MRSRISSRPLPIAFPLLATLACALALAAGRAATPFTQAKVTKVENKVSYGTIGSGQAQLRAARVSDLVKSGNFVQTETESRAELVYDDGSLVRIGQHTVFSFEADSRTLELEKGTLIFHVPKGAGGGTVKTPSLTAAITGTVAKVTPTAVMVLEGYVTMVPSGKKVPAGYVARVNADGLIEVLRFDASKAGDGKLMNFHGPMPGYDPQNLVEPLAPYDPTPDLSPFDTLDRTQNLPFALQHFFPPDINTNNHKSRIVVPPPTRGGGHKPPAY
jgi:hypothetical protein